MDRKHRPDEQRIPTCPVCVQGERRVYRLVDIRLKGESSDPGVEPSLNANCFVEVCPESSAPPFRYALRCQIRDCFPRTSFQIECGRISNLNPPASIGRDMGFAARRDCVERSHSPRHLGPQQAPQRVASIQCTAPVLRGEYTHSPGWLM